jgi:hypothetical protein
MISIPIEKIKELGYTPEKEIAKICSTILSEYDTYEKEFQKQKIKTKIK